MITPSILEDIRTNVNTGVEYEIALFYCLLPNQQERERVWRICQMRADFRKISEIARRTEIVCIDRALHTMGRRRVDCIFATQDDTIGPADILMVLDNGELLGVSVKYDNSCTLNPSARNYLTEGQIDYIKSLYPVYKEKHIAEMRSKYGHARNWHRKRSSAVAEYVDKMRDEVLLNWPNINKERLLEKMCHKSTTVPFWIYKFGRGSSCTLTTVPYFVPNDQISNVRIAKYQSSYIGFYLGRRLFGKLQVKFNDGIIETMYNSKGERRKGDTEFIIDGVEFKAGDPVSSWNFTVEE